MDKLKELQQKLDTRPAFQLDVIDCITEKEFQKAVNKEYLNKHHNGSLGNFLQSLQAKGLQKLQLNQRLKNGSSSKNGGPSVNVDFTNGSPTAQNAVTSAPVPPQMPLPAGLGAAASFGLGVPDILEGYAAKSKYEMLLQQHNQLLADYKEEKECKRKWREKAEKYLRENDQHSWEKNTEKEPSKFDKILDGIFQNPEKTIPALMGAFKQFKGGGLNAPQDAQVIDSLEGYSEMKRALCEMIGQLPDDFCNDLANLISRVVEGDKMFIKELKKLLETPNLKAVQNG